MIILQLNKKNIDLFESQNTDIDLFKKYVNSQQKKYCYIKKERLITNMKRLVFLDRIIKNQNKVRVSIISNIHSQQNDNPFL